MTDKPLLLIKIGGKAAVVGPRLDALAAELYDLNRQYSIVLVHGGGAEVSEFSRRLGLEPVFQNGIRLTSPAEMDIVDMVLCGLINKRLVRLLRQTGLDAVGLSGSDGGLFSGVGGTKENRTGETEQVSLNLLNILLAHGYFPVIATTSTDRAGWGLNINADSAAFALAVAVRSAALVFISDIPGILKDQQVMRHLKAAQIEEEIAAGVVTGGMIPKVRAALGAIKSGVSQIVIGQYSASGDLGALLDGGQGTHISL